MLLKQVKELINAFKIVKRKSQPYSFKGSSKKIPSELFKGKAFRNSKGLFVSIDSRFLSKITRLAQLIWLEKFQD